MQELVNLYFDNNFIDSTNRHTFVNNGVVIAPSDVSSASAEFDGASYLITDTNLSDFVLGATLNPHPWTGQPPLSVYNDNNFTFECWVYPELGGARYYPICSSFSSDYWGSSYKTGWVIQLDTATGHLQMIGYYGNLWTNCLLEYNFQVPFDQWTYLTIMSWRVDDQIAPSAKIVFKNGIPARVTTGDLYPQMGFTNGISNSNSQYQYAPFYVGAGPSSQFTDSGESWLSDLSLKYYFKGKIDSLRICLGPRFLNVDDNNYIVSFSPPGAITTTTTTVTTTSTSTSPPVLTHTTTTSTTQSTSTTSIPSGYLGSLVALPFNLTTNDLTQRHITSSNFNSYTVDEHVPGGYCANFDGSSDIEYIYSLTDWTLNSTNCPLYCQKNISWNYFANYPDNYFTIDCWVKIVSGGNHYYPICSSFNYVGTGWSLQVNTSTMKLQFVGFALQEYTIDLSQNSTAKDYNGALYSLGSINLLLESNFTLSYDSWNHVAVSSYRIANQTSAKIMYLNGVPDRNINYVIPNCVWSSRGQININSPNINYGSLKIGSSPVYSLPTISPETNYFKGYINNLEITKGNKFPVDGTSFSPHLVGLNITSTTSTTLSTTISSTSTDTTTITTLTTNSTTSTTQYISQIEELLLCPFISNTDDVTSRHALSYMGRNYTIDNSFVFDGGSYFSITDNLEDFMLGSTPVRLATTSPNFTSSRNNLFTFDCWLKIYPGGQKYYPICSSFSHSIYGLINPPVGWFIQIDIESGHLQIGGLNNLNNVYTSTFVLPINDSNQWSHIAVMMWDSVYQNLQINKISAYLNGVPDRYTPLPNAGPNLSNIFFGSAGTLPGNYSNIYVGLSPKTLFTDPNSDSTTLLNVNYGYKFIGRMKGLRFCQGNRYPILKDNSNNDRLIVFVPPTMELLPSSTLTTSTTTLSTSITTSITSSTYTTGTTTTYSTTTTWVSSTITYTTITPILPYTNVSINGTATASSFMDPYYPNNAFNHDSNTFWLCTPYEAPPYWLKYELSESYAVDQYKLFLTSGGRPKSWILQGSTDDFNWTNLDEQLNIDTEGLINISFSNSTPYLYYRLYITDVWSRSYGIRVNELQLYTNCSLNKLETDMHWLGTDLRQPTLVQRYCLNVPDGATFTEWKLQGSNDNYFWVDIDHQVTAEWIGWKTIELESNTLSFTKWRILIMNWGENSKPGLVEFELFRR